MEFMVTPETLRSTAKQIRAQVDAYRTATAAAKAAGDNLASKWEGVAKDAFVRREEQNQVWYKDIAEKVTAFAAELDAAAERYEQADSSASGNF